MSLIKLERLLLEVQRVLDGEQEGAADVAREIAAATKNCNQRLQQVAFLLSKGEAIQALQLAEEPPAIQEVLRLLGFEKIRDWKKLCQQKAWPLPEDPDEKTILQLNEAYLKSEKNKQGHQSLLDAYRGKMLKGDRLSALSLLKAHLRRNPNDGWAVKEHKNVIEAEARSQYQKLHKSLTVMDEATVAQQMDVLDSVGLGNPDQEMYQRGNMVRTGYRKKQIESEVISCQPNLHKWRGGDLWEEAVQYFDDLRQRAREFGVKLPNNGDLYEGMRWADSRRADEIKKVQIAELEGQVRNGLARLEDERGRQQRKTRAETIESLAEIDRWQRRANELSHRLDAGLDQRVARESMMLRQDEAHMARRTKTAIGAFVFLITGTLMAVGWLAFKRGSEDRLKSTIGKLIQDREIKAAESFLQLKQAELQSTLLADRERLNAFIEREKATCNLVHDEIGKFAQTLRNTERHWPSEFTTLQKLRKDVNALPRDFQNEIQNELDLLENEWQKMAAEEKRRRADIEKNTLQEIELQLDKIGESQSSASSATSILESRLTKVESDREDLIAPLRSGEEIGTWVKKLQQKLIKKKGLVNNIEQFRSKLNEVARKGDLDSFQQLLNEASESSVLPTEIAEKARNAAQLEKKPEVLTLKLWMPYALSDGKSILKEQTSYLPSGLPLPKEKEAAEKLQSEFLSEIYMYQIPDPKRVIYVRGKIQNFKREDQGEYAINIFLFDPESQSSAPRFVKTPKIKVASPLDAPTPVAEPLGELLKKTKISEFTRKISDDENFPLATEPLLANFMDQLFNANSVDPLGRGYVACRLKELCEEGLRPEQFGMTYAPSLRRKFTELGGLPLVEEGEWLLNSKRKDPVKLDSYKKFFELPPQHPGYAKESIFLASLAKQHGIKFVGCVDEAGMFPELGDGYFLVPEEKGIKVFRKERYGLIPFCPIYKLDTEPMEAVKNAAARAGIDLPLADSILRQYAPGVIEEMKP
jgi:hypothetical protein